MMLLILISCILMGHERQLISIIVVIHVFSEKCYLKDINYCNIYWQILHLPNFSNNELLYKVILLLPFAKCFISVNGCLIRKAKTCSNSKLSLLLLNLTKELKLIFQRIKFMISETVRSKKNKITQL